MAQKATEVKSREPHRSHGAGSNGFKADPVRARQAGERGGATTRDRYGSEFYRQVGARGGQATREKLGRDHFVAIGRRGGLHKNPSFRQIRGSIRASDNRSLCLHTCAEPPQGVLSQDFSELPGPAAGPKLAEMTVRGPSDHPFGTVQAQIDLC